MITKKLKGYQPHRRERHQIAKRLDLDNEEYRLWDLIVAVCGWDKAHEDRYRRVKATYKELGDVLGPGWSEATVSRVIRRIANKNLIEIISRSEYRVKVRAEKGSEEEDEVELAQVKVELAQVKEYVAPVKVVQGEMLSSSLVSSKVNYIYRIDEDYQRIYEAGGYQLLTPDDMKWIDKNIGKSVGYG